MRTWQKLAAVMAALAVITIGFTGAVAAGSDTHIYGLVFVDSNLNGVWDPGEEGYTGQWQESWADDEYISEFVGATVSFHAGDPDNPILLASAVPNSTTAAYAENGQDLCTYQDLTLDDGDDADSAPDVNATTSRPCFGTFGLRPAGESGAYWTVQVTPPEGYVVTSTNPQYVTAGSDTGWVDFGIAPVGAGGPTEAPANTASSTVLSQALARAVAAGVITQAQANAILALLTP